MVIKLFRRTPEPTQLERYNSNDGHRWNQDLESRGYLRFLYQINNDEVWDRVLPFIENPVFNESRAANYAENNILGRNEQARLYTGSKARRIDTRFTYTLPHLAHFIPTDTIVTEMSKAGYTQKELSQVKEYITNIISQDVTHDALEMQYENDPFEFTLEDNRVTRPDQVPGPSNIPEDLATRESGPRGPFLSEKGVYDSVWNAFMIKSLVANKRETELLSLMQSAINHIRSCVVGTSTRGPFGPPIVELKWGSLYNEVPCIVKDYRIELNDKAGYNTKTLLPQQIDVSLTLEEINQAHPSLNGLKSPTDRLPGYETITQLNRFDDNGGLT